MTDQQISTDVLSANLSVMDSTIKPYDYQIPLAALPLPSQYEKLLKKIRISGYQVPETIGGLMGINPDSFGLLQGVGLSYVKALAELQQELPAFFKVWEDCKIPVSSLPLSSKYKKLLAKIRFLSLEVPETMGGIMGMNPDAFGLLQGVGRVFVLALTTLQQELPSLLKAWKEIKLKNIFMTPANDQLPLANMSLSSRYEWLLKQICSCHFLEMPETIGELLELNPNFVKTIPNAGLYVETLKELQQELVSLFHQGDENLGNLTYQHLPATFLSSLYLNHASLNAEQAKIVRKLEKYYNQEINVQGFLAINRDQLCQVRSFGHKFSQIFIKLQEQIANELSQQAYEEITDIRQRGLFVSNEIKPVGIALMDKILVEDVDHYLGSLDKQDRNLALSRWGYNQKQESLELIGQYRHKTKEWVRQQETQINSYLRLNLRIHPQILWANIREQMTSELMAQFPKLAQCFEIERLFYRFLEICCGIKKGSIRYLVLPKVNQNILSHFFSHTSSPVSREQVLGELMSGFGYNLIQAENILIKFIELEKIQITENGIIPVNMDKNTAVAHLLTHYPAGLFWKDIARIVNDHGYSQNPFCEKRQDLCFGQGDKFYLCRKGTYRHIMFLELSQTQIQKTVLSIKSYFEQLKTTNIHLQDYFYQNKDDLSIDYFTLRYMIRTFGEEHGLYFNGRSNVDNVSLESNESWLTQKDVIVNALQSASSALTKPEIAERIRSHSIKHAALYLELLQEEGRVVRIDEMMYTTPDKAFQNIDKQAIMRVIHDIMRSATSMVESDIFREHLNQQLNLNYSKHFYASLIKTQIESLGWHFSRNLFSTQPIPYKGLGELFQSQCHPSLSNKENIRQVRKFVCLTDSVANNAISRWRWLISEFIDDVN